MGNYIIFEELINSEIINTGFPITAFGNDIEENFVYKK